MHRVLTFSRQVSSTSSRNCVRGIKRRMATEATPAAKNNVIRSLFLTTTAVTGTFYVGSAFLSFNHQVYYDFFSDNVPLGRSMLAFGESQGWDNLTVGDVIKASTGLVLSSYHFVNDLITGKSTSSEAEKGKSSIENKQKSTEPRSPPTAFKVIKNMNAKAEEPSSQTKKTEVQAIVESKPVLQKVSTVSDTKVKQMYPNQDLYDYPELLRRAEAAIAGKAYSNADELMPKVITVETLPVDGTSKSTAESSKPVYDLPLPIGFEPPPGFSRPSPPKPVEEKLPASGPEPEVVVLPLVAPAVSSASEPIVKHLAGTIDSLSTYLKSDPNAAHKAGDILESAKGDLTALVDRIELVREQERNTLVSKLDEQSREYTLKLMELEMEAQDKLDHQEEEFKHLFEQERAKFVQAYREKLDHELEVQTELINERLKEEVIAQGIELQRRWIRDVKMRVEEERGGRLAKLDELSSGLKRLEQLAKDNTLQLDENIRIHSLWSAIRALTNCTISSTVRRAFRDELRVLRHITAAREDPVIAVVLDSLEGTDIPDVGVEPLADLATWFVEGVAPKVSEVALVPDENAGVLSYAASRALSSLRFKRRGLVPGDDVLSVLARAEYYLNEKDLDSAARELNQLKGPAEMLLYDWLTAARRRLEVQQALEVVQTQATLAALLVV